MRIPRSPLASRAASAGRSIAAVLPWLGLALLTGCNESTMSTFEGHSDLTKSILDIYGTITWIDTALFILVQGVLIVAVIKFRATGKETELPEQVHGNLPMEIGWTIAPVLILMMIAIPTVSLIFDSQAQAKDGALIVNATGKQWWFQFGFPQYNFETANELHIPLGRQVDIRLQSDNVIHAFWAPQIAAKRDMIPGRVNHITFTADKIGEYLGQCAEYCQDSHALMKFRIEVESSEDFEKWAKAQATPQADTVDDSEGYKAFQGATCVACHAIDGTNAQGHIGPSLTHVGSRKRFAASVLEMNEANLKLWLKDPSAVKPGCKMPNLKLTDEQINTIVPFLQSLK